MDQTAERCIAEISQNKLIGNGKGAAITKVRAIVAVSNRTLATRKLCRKKCFCLRWRKKLTSHNVSLVREKY